MTHYTKWNRTKFLLCLFPIVALFLLITCLYFLSFGNYPNNDSNSGYLAFRYFYNVYCNHNEYAMWLPYASFGRPAYLEQITSLIPASFFIILVGKFLDVTTPMILYQAQLVIEQIPFLLGICLLCRLWYRHWLSSVIVVMATFIPLFTQGSIYFQLRVYYYLPLALYFFCRFYTEKKSWLFWAGSIIPVIGFFGNQPYCSPPMLLMLVAVQIPMAIRYRASLRALLSLKPDNILPLVAFIGICAFYLYNLYGIMYETVSMAPGRNAENFNTEIGTYMTLCVFQGSFDILRLLISGMHAGMLNPGGGSFIIYIGILPLLFAVVAALRVRNVWFISVSLAAFISLLVASGGLMSLLSYYFPGMMFFRYLICFVYFFRVFLILMAGWGCEYILKNVRPKMLLWGIFGLLLAVDLSVTPKLGISLSASVLRTLFFPTFQFCHQFWYIPLYCFKTMLYVVLFLFSAFFLWKRVYDWHPIKNPYTKSVLLFLLVVILSFDLVTYRLLGYRLNYDISEDEAFELSNSASMQRASLTYEPRRRNIMNPDELTELQKERFRVATYKQTCLYPSYTNAAQVDNWCISEAFNTLLISKFAYGLIHALRPDFSHPDDPANDKFRFLVGNTSDKLRWVPNAVIVSSDDKAAEQLKERSIDNLKNNVILISDPSVHTQDNVAANAISDSVPEYSAPLDTEALQASFEIKHFSANMIEFDAVTPANASGWIIYADTFSNNWMAAIDGAPVQVWRANIAFKAIRIPAGFHKVTFRYNGQVREKVSWVAAIFCLLSTLFFIGYFLWICLPMSIKTFSESDLK